MTEQPPEAVPAFAEIDPTEPEEPVGLQRSVIRAAQVGALTGLLVAFVDWSHCLSANFTGSRVVLAVYLLLLFGCVGSAGGALVGVWCHAVRTLRARVAGPRGGWLAILLAALPFTAFAFWVPWSWLSEHWSELGPVARGVVGLVYAGLLAACVGLCVLWPRFTARYAAPHTAGHAAKHRKYRSPRYPAWLILACLTIAAGCYAADARILVGLYEDFHHGLAGGFVLGLATAVQLAACNLRRRRAERAAESRIRFAWLGYGPAALSALFLIALVLRLPAERNLVRAEKALNAQRAVGVVWALSDYDDDGYSTFLGGEDCAALDATHSPAAFDIPGNQLDEDCSGSDARWPIPGPAPSGTAPAPGMNVLLISVDTLRADHLGTYGYARPTSPNIDALAARSAVFLNAFSQSPKTFDSIPSWLTGLYPTNLPRNYRHSRLRGAKPYTYALTEDARTLTELLKREGYKTNAVVSLNLLKQLGLDRSFDKFEVTRKITGRAKALLKNAKAPFFLWLHYDEPHHPYEKHAPHDFGSTAIDRYDSEIAYVDGLIGQVLATLEERKLADNTLVILTADHGEEFREHGGQYHAPKLYQELLHVPLIVHVPGNPAVRNDEIVELVDLVPSLCEKLALLPTCNRFDGQSLWATLRGERQHGFGFGGAYAEALFARDDPVGFNSRSLLAEGFRFNRRITTHTFELYDRRVDPQEQHNVYDQRRSASQELAEELRLRPYRQLGDILRRAEQGDTLDLLGVLPRLREEPVLSHALQLLTQHPPSGLRQRLLELRKRPGLSPKLAQQVQQALEGFKQKAAQASPKTSKQP